MAKLNPKVIFHDDHVIAVAKPPGLLSIAHRFDLNQPHLAGWLSNQFGDIFPVHRLDRETSGILVFARNADAHRMLNQQFEDRTVVKEYRAICQGVFPSDERTIDLRLEYSDGRGRSVVTRSGKEAVSHVYVIERFKNATYLRIEIETGRTHQIRAHLEGIQYPLLVDAVYGGEEAFYLSSVKKRKFNLKRDTEERPLLTRTPLHSFRLNCDHPLNGERMTFEAPLPKDMSATLNQLRKWAGRTDQFN